ncbi:hypothetical protein [Halobacillus naozhouensis]|uniref:Uridine kinase n=1 Tax=Halobacillus naozhouensis TaxID=554880 RepID=A0ABY8IU52_9BACI|nr:hypothetical protein [Halobacillus naozhouensis]WFT73605.1 hypothetical protein P9989_14650 [Halobacillus naozhouensis]
MNAKPYVISIAAVSGGGKTAVTNELGSKLKGSKKLFFDDYEFENSPKDLIEWVKEEPDYDQWDLEPLISDFRSLLETKETPSYIILDYPFAYKNRSMKSYINLSVYIDTPLDVAMARRFLRDHKNSSSSEIHNDLKFYLDNGRDAYLEMETIKSNSDLIIDGTLPIDKIVNIILQILP